MSQCQLLSLVHGPEDLKPDWTAAADRVKAIEPSNLYTMLENAGLCAPDYSDDDETLSAAVGCVETVRKCWEGEGVASQVVSLPNRDECLAVACMDSDEEGFEEFAALEFFVASGAAEAAGFYGVDDPTPAEKACNVIARDPAIVAFLEAHDPKALAQVRAAAGLE